MSPRELDVETKRLVSILARYGGLAAAEIYGRLDLHQRGIRLRTFRLYVEQLRARAPGPGRGSDDIRAEALADLFLKWLCRVGRVKLERAVARAMCRRLGITCVEQGAES